MKEILETVTREEGEMSMPQSVNCIDYFRKRFFKHFTDELNKKVWVGGGAIRDYFSEGLVTKDIDFFCVDRLAMAKLVKVLRNKFEYKHYLITRNAIKGYCMVWGKRIDVDIVKKPFKNPIECIDAFDFTVCCFACNADNFYYHKSAIFDLIRKRLVIHKLPHPVDSLKRLNKYTIKGFKACNGTLLTLAKAIAEQDPKNESLFDFYKFD